MRGLRREDCGERARLSGVEEERSATWHLLACAETTVGLFDEYLTSAFLTIMKLILGGFGIERALLVLLVV